MCHNDHVRVHVHTQSVHFRRRQCVGVVRSLPALIEEGQSESALHSPCSAGEQCQGEGGDAESGGQPNILVTSRPRSVPLRRSRRSLTRSACQPGRKEGGERSGPSSSIGGGGGWTRRKLARAPNDEGRTGGTRARECGIRLLPWATPTQRLSIFRIQI